MFRPCETWAGLTVMSWTSPPRAPTSTSECASSMAWVWRPPTRRRSALRTLVSMPRSLQRRRASASQAISGALVSRQQPQRTRQPQASRTYPAPSLLRVLKGSAHVFGRVSFHFILSEAKNPKPLLDIHRYPDNPDPLALRPVPDIYCTP